MFKYSFFIIYIPVIYLFSYREKGATEEMLQLKNIIKTYRTGDVTQDALKGVTLSFRKNEFVSILGQSGSGKTTMLNIIGGLIPALKAAKKDPVVALRTE